MDTKTKDDESLTTGKQGDNTMAIGPVCLVLSAALTSLTVHLICSVCDSSYLQHRSRSFGFAEMLTRGQGIFWQDRFILKPDFDVDGCILLSFFH